MAKDPDGDLVERARQNDMKATEQLYRSHGPAIRAYALRCCGRPDLADEITQETFIRAFRGLAKFRAGSTFRTWLFSIAINTTRTQVVRNKRHTGVELDEEVASEAPPSSTGWLRRRLLDALATLPEGYREVVVMHDVLDMRHEEIAEARLCSVGTSKSQLSKARARLRSLLGSQIGAADV